VLREAVGRSVPGLLEALPDLEILRAEKARRRLHDYVRWAWPIVDPAPFIDNWSVGAVCDHLEAITRGEIQDLVINVPPRMAKSTTVCVFWPTWEWIDHPAEQFLCTSHREELAIRDAVKSRRLIQSPQYQAVWGDRFHLSGDVNLKSRYENDRMGHRISVAIGSSVGENATRVIADDPHNTDVTESEPIRKAVIQAWDGGLAMRRNNPKRDARVIIMQRQHGSDLVGHVLKQGGWVHLKLPMEHEGRPCVTVLGLVDPRKKIGELIWPERFPRDVVEKLKVGLGDFGTSAQFQQEPSPTEGGLFKRRWFRLWPSKLKIPVIEHLVLIYDTAYSGPEQMDGDPSAGIALAVVREPATKRRVALLVDAWSERLEWPELRKQVHADWKARYCGSEVNDPRDPGRRPDALVIEAKASGISLIQDLQRLGVPAVPAKKIYGGRYELDKVARATNISALVQAGLLYVLESEKRPGEPRSWANDVIVQLMQLPRGEHDDLADAAVHGLTYLQLTGLLEALLEPPQLSEEQAEAQRRYAEQQRQRAGNPYAR
jgi:predicted phage terminase large subunit-like protein